MLLKSMMVQVSQDELGTAQMWKCSQNQLLHVYAPEFVDGSDLECSQNAATRC